MTTLKNPIFIGFFGFFPFLCFFFCFCFYSSLSNIKKTKTKNAIFFSKTSFLINPKFCKNTILTHCDTICVSKNAKKHYKTGEKQQKNLDQFLTYNLDQFLTYKTPNLGPVFNFTAYIYIYIYIYICWGRCHIYIYMPTSQAKGRILTSDELNKGTRRCPLWTAKM